MVEQRGTSNLDREDPPRDLPGVKRISDILRQLVDERGWTLAVGHTPPNGDSPGGHDDAWYRDRTAASVRRIDRDKPTQTLRPGERVDPDHDTNEQIIINRDQDFAQFVIDQVNLRERTGSRLARTDGRS